MLSGLDPDPHWTVRSALASVLGTLPAEVGLPRLQVMRDDSDERVIPAVLTSLAALRAAGCGELHFRASEDRRPGRARGGGHGTGSAQAAIRPGAPARGVSHRPKDTTYVARGAALAALAEYGAATATPALTEALSDSDWAVRVRAAALLKQLDPSSDAARRIRPAPTGRPDSAYETPRLLRRPCPRRCSSRPIAARSRSSSPWSMPRLTVETFVTLARKGFYDGLTFHRVVPDFVIQGGDPRGDGEGGPGFTIRDELSQRPYLRGVVGIALDWEDTGGSQFFITHSPQPHLDARYTVIGRVLSGMDVVDQIQPGDVMRRVRVWDGVQ